MSFNKYIMILDNSSKFGKDSVKCKLQFPASLYDNTGLIACFKKCDPDFFSEVFLSDKQKTFSEFKKHYIKLD